MNVPLILWLVIITLAALAILQAVYLLWLTFAPARNRAPLQPASPLMPTRPQTQRAGKMVIVGGLNTTTREIPLPANHFGIGRFYKPEENILVTFDEKSISRRHAVFEGDDTTLEYYLIDASTYGTSIQKNGQFEPLAPGQRERIFNNDIVRFGDVVTVRFSLPGGAR
jgi:hypothetical protein